MEFINPPFIEGSTC